MTKDTRGRKPDMNNISRVWKKSIKPPNKVNSFMDAQRCDPITCRLPNCFCSTYGKEIPGGLDPKNVPQMITLTFDDFLPEDIFKILNSRFRNPNGCTIKATVSCKSKVKFSFLTFSYSYSTLCNF